MIAKLVARRRVVVTVTAVALLAVLGLVPATSVAQSPIVIKIATLVPKNTSWFTVIQDVAAKWDKLSGGRVKVTLYPGGIKGDDPQVVETMRLGDELNGAVLTSVGLAAIEPSVYALSIPMAYDSYEEVYAVEAKMQPRLEAAIAAKGFVVLNWADGGWIRFFTKQPVAVPDDLKKLKLFQWAGDAKSLEIWKTAGFNPRPGQYSDLMVGLQNGMFEACSLSPQVAVIGRYYEKANCMTDMDWALLLAATVVKKDTWAKVPADLKPLLLGAMREAGTKLQADIRQSAPKDIAAMQKAGLKVVPVNASARAQWKKMIEASYGKIRGDFVPADAFDEAMKYRDEYRKTAAKK
jgi:TRAP-type C4-dicarboxylate transport system substrate-binding protein